MISDPLRSLSTSFPSLHPLPFPIFSSATCRLWPCAGPLSGRLCPHPGHFLPDRPLCRHSSPFAMDDTRRRGILPVAIENWSNGRELGAEGQRTRADGLAGHGEHCRTRRTCTALIHRESIGSTPSLPEPGLDWFDHFIPPLNFLPCPDPICPFWPFSFMFCVFMSCILLPPPLFHCFCFLSPVLAFFPSTFNPLFHFVPFFGFKFL